MRDRLGPLVPLCLLAFVMTSAIGGLVAYANSASAEPATSTEYAEYHNDLWHYSLAVPKDMIASEHEREGGGHTTQFLHPTGDKELIISAWPYTQLDLTLGKEGSPDTALDQSDQLEIVDVVRDDLFTVLFQKNGIRYSIITLPEDEAWLTELLTTWRFTD
jgi:hypothetical protein